jgi:hypothetical protein
MFDNESGIPQVKFADPELMNKLNIPMPPGAQPQTQPNAGAGFDFSKTAQPQVAPQGAPRATPQMQTPNIGLAPDAPQVQNMQPLTAPFVDNSTPAAGESETEKPKEIDTDGPEAAFAQTYDALSKVQRNIVDTMASNLKFADLFQKRRFSLKFNIVPGQLQATFVSMTQEENEQFWQKFRDIQLNKFEVDLMMSLYRCVYTVAELNGNPIPPENRLGIFKSFDTSLIHTLSNYSSLFELAKMKVLYQSFLTIRGE